MNHTESKIQSEIVQYLQKEKIFFFSVPNEAAAGNAKRQMTMIALGCRPGAPDLTLFYPKGKVTFIEVKSLTGRLSKVQEQFKILSVEHGIDYHVVRSVDDVKCLLS